MEYPELIKVKQNFDSQSIEDIEGVVHSELQAVRAELKPGTRIAIAVGSRGINNLDRIVTSTVEYLRSVGVEPFIVPAMGSHGGATAAGQEQVLAGYGITEPLVGARVVSSMEAVELEQGDLPHKIYMDRQVYESDGVIVINRVKPHTDFHDEFESGLVKMIVIGLGKHEGAIAIHDYGTYGLRDLIPRSAKKILALGKVLIGLGIVENSYDETCRIQAIPAAQIMEKEPVLLDLARERMPQLPLDEIDILIVDRMGKDISGTGMDTNILGRIKIAGEKEPETPKIHEIIVTDLTDVSHGNATGMGLADITTRRLFEKIDLPATNENVYTSSFLERGKIPLVAETEEKAFLYALRGCGKREKGEEKIVRIKDTLHLGEIWVSEAAARQLKNQSHIEVTTERAPLLTEGSFSPVW